MVSALAREVDRSKHRSVYWGECDRGDAYARPRWWCGSPHQLTPPLFLLVSQFPGPLINKQTSVLHKKPRFINNVCAIGKSAQQAHPTKATYNTGAPFQPISCDLMGPITPEALDDYRYASKFTDAVQG